jgi:O-antigen ligase
VYLAVLVLCSLVGLKQLLSGNNELMRAYWGARSSLSLIEPRFDVMTGIFFDGNRFANFLVSGFFLCLPLVIGTAERPLARLVAAPALAFVLVIVYFCFSVGNWLALAAGTVVWLLYWGKHKTLLVALMALATALLLTSNFGTPSADFLPPEVYAKLDALARLDFGPNSPLHIRVDLVKGGFEMFKASPFFGIGYGGYQPWIARSMHYLDVTRGVLYSHNSYVLVLAELGLVGLALLLAFLGTCIARGHANLKRARSVDLKARQIGMLAAIVENLVFLATYDSILYDLNLWIAVGLTLAMTTIIENERAAAPSRSAVPVPRRNGSALEGFAYGG